MCTFTLFHVWRINMKNICLNAFRKALIEHFAFTSTKTGDLKHWKTRYTAVPFSVVYFYFVPEFYVIQITDEMKTFQRSNVHLCIYIFTNIAFDSSWILRILLNISFCCSYLIVQRVFFLNNYTKKHSEHFFLLCILINIRAFLFLYIAFSLN